MTSQMLYSLPLNLCLHLPASLSFCLVALACKLSCSLVRRFASIRAWRALSYVIIFILIAHDIFYLTKCYDVIDDVTSLSTNNCSSMIRTMAEDYLNENPHLRLAGNKSFIDENLSATFKLFADLTEILFTKYQEIELWKTSVVGVVISALVLIFM